MALILDHLSTDRDPCAWYFVNYAIDTFLGVFVAWLFLLLLRRLAVGYDLEHLRDMGEYGKPPRWMYALQSPRGADGGGSCRAGGHLPRLFPRPPACGWPRSLPGLPSLS